MKNVEKYSTNVMDYENMIHSIILKYYSKFLHKYSQEDLFSIGVEGFLLGKSKYNPEKGTTFFTFIFNYVRWHILRRIREDKWNFKSRNSKTGVGEPVEISSLNVLAKDDGNEIIDLLASEENIEEYIVKKDMIEGIRNLVYELPNRTKEITIAYYFDELNQIQISEIFSISQATVSRELISSRKILREKIQKLYGLHGAF